MNVVKARLLRKSMTRYEVKLWLHLRELKLLGFRFRRQVPIERYIVDFACFQSRLVIEADGGQHGFEGHAAADEIRDETLEQIGFHVMRFLNHEIWTNIQGIVETIITKGQPRLRKTSP